MPNLIIGYFSCTTILEITGLNLIQSKNNKKVYIAKVCPFCGNKGKRPFRYNSKLKVGKAYCCGVSFKDLSWLNTILTDRDKYEIKRIQDNYWDESYKEYAIKKYFEDKLNVKPSGFEKSDDDDLPF